MLLNGVLFVGSIAVFHGAILPVTHWLLGRHVRTLMARHAQPSLSERGFDATEHVASLWISQYDRFLSLVYYLLWIYPIYLISLALNNAWYHEIAVNAYRLYVGEPVAKPASYDGLLSYVASEVYRALLLLNYLVIAIVIDAVVPYFGRALSFCAFCWLASLYTFEYHFAYKGWPLDHRLAYIERHWAYFLGFGMPLSAATFFLSPTLQQGIYALLFPMTCLNHPPATRRAGEACCGAAETSTDPSSASMAPSRAPSAARANGGHAGPSRSPSPSPSSSPSPAVSSSPMAPVIRAPAGPRLKTSAAIGRPFRSPLIARPPPDNVTPHDPAVAPSAPSRVPRGAVRSSPPLAAAGSPAASAPSRPPVSQRVVAHQRGVRRGFVAPRITPSAATASSLPLLATRSTRVPGRRGHQQSLGHPALDALAARQRDLAQANRQLAQEVTRLRLVARYAGQADEGARLVALAERWRGAAQACLAFLRDKVGVVDVAALKAGRSGNGGGGGGYYDTDPPAPHAAGGMAGSRDGASTASHPSRDPAASAAWLDSWGWDDAQASCGVMDPPASLRRPHRDDDDNSGGDGGIDGNDNAGRNGMDSDDGAEDEPSNAPRMLTLKEMAAMCGVQVTDLGDYDEAGDVFV
ncbi:EI24-domain-containing protein [Caulochytrium protostelioides]|nr:EI24-domain-containing protein [Caulochytrium protostelioides]